MIGFVVSCPAPPRTNTLSNAINADYNAILRVRILTIGNDFILHISIQIYGCFPAIIPL